MSFARAVVAAGVVAASTSAFAANITGAGATFPFPISSKWADAYTKETGNGLKVDRFGRLRPTFRAKIDQLDMDGLVRWPMVMGAIVAVANPGKITKWDDPAIKKLKPNVR